MTPKKPVVADPEESIEKALTNTEMFFEKNGKKLLIALAVIALAIGGYFGYDNFIVQPKSQSAANAMFEAQIQFERDSFATALNGVQGVFLGFDAVASEYSGTPQGNVANHYAGICAMNMGDFQKAIAYFEKYSAASKGAGDVLAAQNFGLMGDCNVELGNNAKGVELYKKAISASASVATAPLYTHKIAIALYTEGKLQEAIEMFKTIKTQYPSSIQARDADRYIALVEQQL